MTDMIDKSSAAPAPSNSRTPAVSGRDRARYLTASGVALWGAQIGQVAVPLTAVTALHAGASATALLRTALTLPFVLLGLPVGAWLDRVPRRPVMIAADLVRATALTTVPVAYWCHALTMAQLLAVVTVQGMATVFFDLATQSLVKDLAPGALLAPTNARLATLTQTAMIAAPPLAGWAAGLLNPPTVLLAMAVGYVVRGLAVRSRSARAPGRLGHGPSSAAGTGDHRGPGLRRPPARAARRTAVGIPGQHRHGRGDDPAARPDPDRTGLERR